VCTSSQNGQCDELARSLFSLTPALNTLFGANLTANAISSAIWQAQGAPFGSNCASQAKLIDVAPALDVNQTPNRTTWAQTALLWNLVQSQDLTAIQKMQSFINTAPWSELGVADGPVASSNAFSLAISGFEFDFASQMVTQPNVSFASDANPSSTQLNEVSDTARSVLDRMYSYALGLYLFTGFVIVVLIFFFFSFVHSTAASNVSILEHGLTAETRRLASLPISHRVVFNTVAIRCHFVTRQSTSL
jgi:hypothetical protein